MTTSTTDTATTASAAHGHGAKASTLTLAVGAFGVVFWDIWTSPLIDLRVTFASNQVAPGISPDAEH
ncbi:MAG: hypothetical protein ACK554_09025, partial [Erythrobacteraceae bacterium]